MGFGVPFGMAESCSAHVLSDPRAEYEPRETQSGVLYALPGLGAKAAGPSVLFHFLVNAAVRSHFTV